MSDSCSNHITAPLIGIDRHRLNIDGRGITTLVGLHGCPLKCRYCLNDKCHRADGIWRELSVWELYEIVRCDDLYFRATGGGVTLGGGEPALHSEYIKAFRAVCGYNWNITLESSLNVPRQHIELLAGVVDDYIIDIKSCNAGIYREYTGIDAQQAIDNLHYLIEQGLSSHITVRVPLIPKYNTPEDVEATVKCLQEWGIERIDTFDYHTNKPLRSSQNPSRTGKTVCNILKKVRCMIADANSIDFIPAHCTHTLCTTGHCPTCEKELKMLIDTLSQRESINI